MRKIDPAQRALIECYDHALDRLAGAGCGLRGAYWMDALGLEASPILEAICDH